MDIEKIRADFPYLDSKKVGKDVIYLDTAATSQKPKEVIDAVDNYYKYQNANPHRGAHYLSFVATTAYENSRDKIKEYIGAKKSRGSNFYQKCNRSIKSNRLFLCLGKSKSK